jgi:hypothetical protein
MVSMEDIADRVEGEEIESCGNFCDGGADKELTRRLLDLFQKVEPRQFSTRDRVDRSCNEH